MRIEKGGVFSLSRLPLCLLPVVLVFSVAGYARDINFDFGDADLRAVIQAVAEFTGRNFLVDPAVKGKVTVVAPEPLTEEEAYRVFQSVLEANGYVTVEAGGVIKIVPEEEGKLRGLFPAGPAPGGDDVVTRVIHLEYIRAERPVPILRPLIPAYGHLAGDAKSGSLILTDRVANVERLVNIIKRLDQPARTGEVELVALSARITARVKVLARLNIAEKRVPQDDRISLRLGGRMIDVRVSTLPTHYGERVVMRILEKEQGTLTREQVGMSEEVRKRFTGLIRSPYGIFLVTGPTGSGKTTTLYAALQQIHSPDLNIITVYFPVAG